MDIFLRKEEPIPAFASTFETEVRESGSDPKSAQSLVSYCIKDELESISRGQLGNKGRESFSIPTDDPFANPDELFSIRREENQHLDNLQDAEASEKIDPLCPGVLEGQPGFSAAEQAIITICIKDEDEQYSIDHQDRCRVESPRERQSMSRQQNVSAFKGCTKTTVHNKLSTRKANMNVLQTSPRVKNTRNPLYSKGCWENKGKGTVAWESVFSNSEHYASFQERPQGISPKYNDHESNLKSPLLLEDHTKLQQNLISHSSTAFETKSSHKGEHVGEQKGKYSEVRPYSCTDCEKSFLYKENLIKHYRTHTGEKPCTCTFCHKSFSRKDNLKRHMRMHTGEKPYRCTECGRSFTWKESLNLHQRKHTGGDTFLRKNMAKQKTL